MNRIGEFQERVKVREESESQSCKREGAVGAERQVKLSYAIPVSVGSENQCSATGARARDFNTGARTEKRKIRCH